MGMTNGSPSGGRIKCFLGRCDTNGHKKPPEMYGSLGAGDRHTFFEPRTLVPDGMTICSGYS